MEHEYEVYRAEKAIQFWFKNARNETFLRNSKVQKRKDRRADWC